MSLNDCFVNLCHFILFMVYIQILTDKYSRLLNVLIKFLS